MYLSAERLAIVNQAIVETFAQTSIAWQAIPHWVTGDRGQSRVPSDIVNNPGFLPVQSIEQDFQVTLVQTSAPTPESLINEVNWAAAQLGRKVDEAVLPWLAALGWWIHPIAFTEGTQDVLLNNLIVARAAIEDAGYRAPSCLITNTHGLQYLSSLKSGYPIVDALLEAANVNSLHRTSLYDFNLDVTNSSGTVVSKPATGMVMLGRRQRIPHGAAPDASPGEEPVDLAVSVMPSLEVVGEAPNSMLELSARIRFALRVKDPNALSTLIGIPVA